MKDLAKKEKNSITYIIMINAFLVFPYISHAQSRPDSFSGLVDNILTIVEPLVVLVMVLATFFFLFGVVQYISQHGNEKARGDSVKTITWGIIGLFVMVVMWGLVRLLQESLLAGGQGIGIPQF
jgi:hypothetical protein